ncbi:MAG: hypothetical protein EXR08_00290 [Alphaproteobacteria bacterium]|nr:hypothetical protein [Alphaproteobacteria bacterium]
MKRLYLLRSMRHRSVTASTLKDYHRPLTRRGEIAAMAAGKRMQANGYLPENVICSTATRTRQTLAHIWPYLAHTTGKMPELAYDFHIHLARGDALLQRLQETDAGQQSLLMLSIAPGICDLARLINRPAAGAPDPFANDLPLGALAIFDCAADDWADLTPA